MSRNEHFAVGASEHVDPRNLHPNLNDYPIEVGNTGRIESGVGYVRTDLLAGMHGNETDRQGIDRHKARLASGEGFEDPVMVEFDPHRRMAMVGEGNHRVEAAREMGITHVPTRVVRSRFSDDEMDYARRHGQAASLDVSSQWRNGRGEEYWPPSMHPRDIFPKDTL